MERHFAVHERPLTFEELVEMSRRNPREVVQMVRGEMMFQQQGEFEFSKSHLKEFYNVNHHVSDLAWECWDDFVIVDSSACEILLGHD